MDRLRTLLLVFFLLAAATFTLAQSQSLSTPPKMVSRSQLVIVPAVVRDKSGQHAKGLTKQDFVIRENGKERTLAFSEEVTTSRDAIARPAVPGEFTNIETRDVAPRRLVIMVLDLINTPMFDQNYARHQMGKFLSSALTDDALIALVTINMSGIRVVHDFTDDRNALLAELAKEHSVPDFHATQFEMMPDTMGGGSEIISKMLDMQGIFVQRINESQRHQSITRTLDALQQLARAYSGVPGRKALVWVTAGFPFSVNGAGRIAGTSFKEAHDSFTELMPSYERAWQVLNDANMSIYTVDARGLVASVGMAQASTYTAWDQRPPHKRWMKEDLEFKDTLTSLRAFAEMTGGKAYVNTNDLASSFRDAAEDSSHYYLLGYYLDSKDVQPGWRNLKVRVRKHGLQLRARQGFFVNPQRDGKKHDLDLALTSPLQLTEIPLTVRWTEQKPVPGSQNVQVGFTVVFKPGAIMIDEANGNRMGFEAVAVAVTPQGKPATDVTHKADTRLTGEQAESIRKTGATYNDFFRLAPGSYTAKFVVRDLVSGRIGSVIAPLTVSP